MNIQLPDTQLRTMLLLQSDMNARVNPEWISQGNKWARAILAETVEAIEHHGWKWWKHQEPDAEQLRMELVDIWHFGMSHVIQEWGGPAPAANAIQSAMYLNPGRIRFDGATYRIESLELLQKLDLMAGLAAADRFEVPLFFSILVDCGMAPETLYRQYIGKNVLNFFRQDHGYKEGTYIKIWDGREDNEHLADLIAVQDQQAPDFPEKLYAALENRYSALTQQPKETA